MVLVRTKRACVHGFRKLRFSFPLLVAVQYFVVLPCPTFKMSVVRSRERSRERSSEREAGKGGVGVRGGESYRYIVTSTDTIIQYPAVRRMEYDLVATAYTVDICDWLLPQPSGQPKRPTDGRNFALCPAKKQKKNFTNHCKHSEKHELGRASVIVMLWIVNMASAVNHVVCHSLSTERLSEVDE